MREPLSAILDFPNEFPAATVGILLRKENILLTGHENGFIVKWDLASKSHEIIHDCGSTVEAISQSPIGEIAVGCHSGLLLAFNLSTPKKMTVLQDATNSKFTRIWRMKWVSQDLILVGSTYGVINQFARNLDQWSMSSQQGKHSDSIFGLGGSNDTIVVSGDWSGKVVIWNYSANGYDQLDSIELASAIEDISVHKSGAFATIDSWGHINFLERDPHNAKWKSVFETDIASSSGKSVLLTEDGKTVFGATNTEIIQFDIDTQQVEVLPFQYARGLFFEQDQIFILTKNGLVSFTRKKVDVPAGAVKYRYAKVSLIGHTGAGKTTLCSLITTGSADDIDSTFGKKVWNLRLPGQGGGVERRMVLHDHGGQETVLDTFLPFLADSDIVLIFFKKIDKSTFEKALRIRKELEPVVHSSAKIFLVETFIDQAITDFDRARLQTLIDQGYVSGCLEISPAKKMGIEDFKQKLIESIDWDSTKTMIRSENLEILERSISALVENKENVVTFEKFKAFHESNSGHPIATNHLRFLLTNFSSQGSIEYYPDVSDSIIFNDEKYNRLRSNIPIEATHKNGIISFEEIQKKFSPLEYVMMLDKLYINFGLAVKNGDLRIFPSKLREKVESVNEPFKAMLARPLHRGEMLFSYQDINIGRLLSALSEMQLHCVDASACEALFAWENNACIYFTYQEIGDAVEGRSIRFSYVVSGQKEARCDRLYSDFQILIERLYGPAKEIPQPDKKKDLKNLEFDVALSFAGEQRAYVSAVYEHLAKKGIAVFYDELYEYSLWGKDLSTHLHRIFYSQSKWCIMFISKEYLAKPWPTHERKAAIAKQIDLKDDEYILPVRFDDTELPGLPRSLRYENACKRTPQEIAELFLKKFEYEGQI